MIVRIHGIGVRNRPAAIALAVVALGVGAVFLAFGIVLLLALAVVGTAVGAGALLIRALTGRGRARLGAPHPDPLLDPALEVFPKDQGAPEPPPAHELGNSQRRKLPDPD